VIDCRRVRSAQVAAATSINERTAAAIRCARKQNERGAQVAAATPMNERTAAAIRCARRKNERGVTLIEALIVIALVAMIAGLSYPAVSSGLDTLRLRSASDSIVSFLNIALDHADRRQQAVEVVVSPKENLLLSRTADLGFSRRLDLPPQLRIVSVQPVLPTLANPGEPRRFLLYPGGSVPRIEIEISTFQGRRRLVSVDPVTGSPISQTLGAAQ
jgi:prepilin-type N-terminal cleavage/methylation domain-containing protein